jgi:hypothetical protein
MSWAVDPEECRQAATWTTARLSKGRATCENFRRANLIPLMRGQSELLDDSDCKSNSGCVREIGLRDGWEDSALVSYAENPQDNQED